MLKPGSTLILAVGSVLAVACSKHDNAAYDTRSTTVPATATSTQTSNGVVDTTPVGAHHSKLKGALLGGAAGAVIGGKKGALLGAAVGAEAQHVKNKKQGY